MKNTLYLVALLFLIVPLGCAPVNAASGHPQAGAPAAPPLSKAEPGPQSPSPDASNEPTVTLRAASERTIVFKTQNGETVDSIPPQVADVPHLVLFRNGALTDPGERTLIVNVSGLTLPPEGVTVTLQVETQHGDPDLGGATTTRIPVWHALRRIANTSGLTQTAVTVAFTHEFMAEVDLGAERIATPTDYYRYHLSVTDTNHASADPRYTVEKDYAFLMESQWIGRLPEVQEASDGAAPDELIVYYCDMFPFRQDRRDPDTWLSRERVGDYVQRELLPAFVEAFRVQTDDWGFPWYDAWTSYRSGEDAERLSVALVKGQTWFHGYAPSNGHSGISLRIDGGGYATGYDSLTHALTSVFRHELFHNLQMSIHQNFRQFQDAEGAGDVWGFVAEGTAVLAAAVGGPAVEMGLGASARHYVENANRYLGVTGLARGELNRSYQNMGSYHAALYWRFLYEQCGGMQNGREAAAAGMDVIRRALVTLYSEEFVGVASSSDFVTQVPALMDKVLKDALCPFKTHPESLIAFARAIYALRLEGGRCAVPGGPVGCGFYDPHHLYHDPPVDSIPYAGDEINFSAADQLAPAGIKSSFGIDFVEIILDPSVDGKPLTLEFHNPPGAAATFNVQLWRLRPGAGKPRAITALPERMALQPGAGVVYTIARVDTAAFDRLALIITRLDPHEARDGMGSYTIKLASR